MMGGIRSERCADKARFTRAASSESAGKPPISAAAVKHLRGISSFYRAATIDKCSEGRRIGEDRLGCRPQGGPVLRTPLPSPIKRQTILAGEWVLDFRLFVLWPCQNLVVFA